MTNRMYELFKNDYKEIDCSLERKLQLLDLNENDKYKLKNIPCNIINICEKNNSIVAKINLTDIVGINRAINNGQKNWLDCLASLHKMYIFCNFPGKEKFNILLNDENSVSNSDLPVVTEYNGEYYISSNGIHRLTIGKCIGIKTALVLINKANL